MTEKKNQVTVLIEDCRHCPNVILKFDRVKKEDFMYCHSDSSLTQLRERWGECSIPDWCPRLQRMRSLCGKRAEIPGILS